MYRTMNGKKDEGEGKVGEKVGGRGGERQKKREEEEKMMRWRGEV